MKIQSLDFFNLPAKELAPKLLGMYLCRNRNGEISKFKITEVEAYCGVNDTACHSRVGKTKRNESMWKEGGTIYVYLCYGLHYMFNIVCAGQSPEAVLIRMVDGASGPGVLTKKLSIDKSFDGIDLKTSDKIWLECKEDEFENLQKILKNSTKNAKNQSKTLVFNQKIEKLPRIGINYASKKDIEAKLRFVLKEN